MSVYAGMCNWINISLYYSPQYTVRVFLCNFKHREFSLKAKFWEKKKKTVGRNALPEQVCVDSVMILTWSINVFLPGCADCLKKKFSVHEWMYNSDKARLPYSSSSWTGFINSHSSLTRQLLSRWLYCFLRSSKRHTDCCECGKGRRFSFSNICTWYSSSEFSTNSQWYRTSTRFEAYGTILPLRNFNSFWLEKLSAVRGFSSLNRPIRANSGKRVSACPKCMTTGLEMCWDLEDKNHIIKVELQSPN